VKRFLVAAVAAALVVGAAGTASAIVTYDGDAWTIGKGDVQSAFGWNAKQTDANFSSVTFEYKKVETTIYDCMNRITGTPTGRVVEGVKTDVSPTVRSTLVETRRNGSSVVTGATVTRTGTPTGTDVVGTCEDNNDNDINGIALRSPRETTTVETLTAKIPDANKGKTNVTEAVMWTETK
jgi:hypothetical protein